MTGPVPQIVVMGVSGPGKSTLGAQVASRLDWDFVEGDRHHPLTNIERMAAGYPLTDADRAPWLASLAVVLASSDAAARPCVLTCSALRRAYRDTLRSGGGRVGFVHLHGERSLLEQRLNARRNHFFEPDLLGSQLATLEPLAGEEDGIVVDIALSLDVQTDQVLSWARQTGRIAAR